MKQLILVLGAIAGLAPAPAAGSNCENLASLQLKDTSISLSQTVTAGQFTPPGGTPITGLPVFCRIVGVIRPTTDSEIGFEVWMPQENWNGRYVGAGNSGFGGAIAYEVMPLLAAGSALASTDNGHISPVMESQWAIGHPEKVIDFAYRAVHLTTTHAKAIIAAYYGKPASKSYWIGCSGGGDQGLALAQRYPADYDGIVAGCAEANLTHMAANTLWASLAFMDPVSALPQSAAETLYNLVRGTCDPVDGLRDGLIDDPRQCRPNLASITCSGGNSTSCLTAAQVSAAQKIYNGPTNPRTGEAIHPGFPPGLELEWQRFTRDGFSMNIFSRGFFNNVVFEDPKWDWRTFDFDFDLSFADAKAGMHTNLTNPDLRTFRALGNKLLQWHGWEDYLQPAVSSIQYYESVQAVFRAYHANGNQAPANTDDFYRLFMIPGMGHCGSGSGLNSWGPMQAITDWVEKGIAPDSIPASRRVSGATLYTRPLCPYPRVARWTGTGSQNDAANFVCSTPDNSGGK